MTLGALWSCENKDYDVSEGIDREITLFSDQVSLPVGSIGPITPKQFWDAESDILDMIKEYITEDEEGYLVVQEDISSDPQYSLLLASSLANQLVPADIPFADFQGSVEEKTYMVTMFALAPSRQVVTLTAANPLTEDIAFSGKMSITSLEGDEEPSETLFSQDFSRVTVPAGAEAAEILRLDRSDWKPVSGLNLENLVLHLPASFLTKDPLGGLGAFSFAYHFKSYISLEDDFPMGIPVELEDLNLELAKYNVKEARIRTEVSNEIPVTLELESVEVCVNETDEKGKVSAVPTDKVSVTQGLSIAAGSTGKPTVTPLEIVIKAEDGTTIPDISALNLSILVKAPVGVTDTRLAVTQRVYFNNIRAIVSGGITLQSL